MDTVTAQCSDVIGTESNDAGNEFTAVSASTSISVEEMVNNFERHVAFYVHLVTTYLVSLATATIQLPVLTPDMPLLDAASEGPYAPVGWVTGRESMFSHGHLAAAGVGLLLLLMVLA